MANFSTGRNKGLNKLRDFSHAAKTFTATGGYPMTPKSGFLFHVRLIYATNNQSTVGGDTNTISVLVRSTDLPQFTIDTDVLNKYNKKEVIQKKITYNPISIVFQDDASNYVRDMWLAYNKHYFVDSNIPQEAYDLDDTYSSTRLASKYGLDTGRTGRFLRHIEIYSMGNHTYTKYTLVNPLITNFDFDRYDYNDGGKVMLATMRVQFENVLYAEGKTEAIPGFGKDSQYYDNEDSQLRPTNLEYPNLGTIVDNIETNIVDATKKLPLSNFDLQTVLPVALSQQQQKTVKVNAVNSLSSNRRFSFPTATEINNLSEVVDINAGKRIVQGIINRSAAISSNGEQIGTGQTSSIGKYNNGAEILDSLVIYPKIPSGLTITELAFFNQSYPPLPSTDSRTRKAPYV